MIVTHFVALSFAQSPSGDFVPGDGQICPDAEAAEALAREMASEHGGAVAYVQTGDPATGEFDEAKVFLAVGNVLNWQDLVETASA
jgi:hypothetical protein